MALKSSACTVRLFSWTSSKNLRIWLQAMKSLLKSHRIQPTKICFSRDLSIYFKGPLLVITAIFQVFVALDYTAPIFKLKTKVRPRSALSCYT